VAVRCSDGESIPDAAFDLVLVDAPCSGSGVLRRLGRTVTPAAAPPAAAAARAAAGEDAGQACDELAARRRRRDRAAHAGADGALAALATLQLSLLREAASRCHDRLVYATCSILREENEEVVAAFDDDAGFEPWPFSPRLEGADGHTRRLLPNRHHDGFFIARWRRRRRTQRKQL